jgi:hypothetical protein
MHAHNPFDIRPDSLRVPDCLVGQSSSAIRKTERQHNEHRRHEKDDATFLDERSGIALVQVAAGQVEMPLSLLGLSSN